MRPRALRIAAALALVAAGGLVLVASGLVPIAASSGHWPVTERILHFAMRRSVATHSFFVEAPPLDDPALVVRGAAHYHGGCRSCHGSPGEPRPVIAAGMTPPPPDLAHAVAEWEPEELFYVVEHGVKFTGMPAWPAPGRDDEVWAVVAFLRELPTLGAGDYRRLALGEGTAPAGSALDAAGESSRAALVQSCARCHGADGRGRGGAFPSLAGQRPVYLRNALDAYARGERHSGMMQPIAAGLGEEAMRELAEHFAALAPAPPAGGGDPAAIARGEEIAGRGIPSRRVPSCVDCHGPGTGERAAAYPLHAGQHADYLVLQLELFREGRRGGSAYASLMRPIASQLSSEEMRDVAAYYASLPATPSAR